MKEILDKFNIDYTLKLNAAADSAIQFGMSFTLTNSSGWPLCQLIYPATSVGQNQSGRWNIDNHIPSGSVQSLIFPNADKGIIQDIPTEISSPKKGVLTTTFAVFMVNIDKKTIYTNGITFGYSIDTNATKPDIKFISVAKFNMDNNQQALIQARCSFIVFGNPQK